MTANEWLEVMKQAQDFPKGMEKLIIKYGEMLIAEHESKVKKSTIPDVMKSLPTTEDIEHFASNKRKQDWSVNVLQLTAVNYFKNSRNEYRNNKL